MRAALSLGVALTLFALLPAAAAKQVTIELRGYRVVLASHGDPIAPDHNLLVVFQAGHLRYFLTAPSIEIPYRAAGTTEGPDLIVTSFGGGSHCCFTVHALTLSPELAEDKIETRDSEPEFDRSATPPRLRFYDFAFAYWKAPFADSPAPLVIMAWDAKSRSYRPDIAAMRSPPPAPQKLAASAAEVRAKFAASAPDQLPAELWGRMLDLIYSGNAAAASRFFDLAWPANRPGKAAFRADFVAQLQSGALWRRYRLDKQLDADRLFK